MIMIKNILIVDQNKSSEILAAKLRMMRYSVTVTERADTQVCESYSFDRIFYSMSGVSNPMEPLSYLLKEQPNATIVVGLDGRQKEYEKTIKGTRAIPLKMPVTADGILEA